MTAVFEQSGIRFLYPENWELDNRDDTGSPWSVSVHSPSGAFWSITVYDGAANLHELCDATLQAVEEDYQQSSFEYTGTQEQIAGQTTTGYDIRFFFLDFLISAQIHTFHLAGQCCVVLYQGEDRDFEQLEQVFQAITYSLFGSD